MYLTSYEPWNLFDRLAGLNGPVSRDGQLARGWAPPVDVEEQEDRYVLRADLPGVDVKDIDITLEKGILKIAGERREEKAISEAGFRRVERSYGQFERQFALPDTADDEKVEASTANGVLEISIAKKATSKPRKIEVKH